MSNTRRSLAQATIVGALWQVFQNAGGRTIGFLSQLVIAAILSPKDFGAIGLAYTVSAFGAVLVNFGVESVLLQRHKTIRLWIVPAFWYSVATGLAGCIAVLIVGPIAARIYDLPEVAPLSALIAIGMPISAISTVPNVLMRTRFQFKQMAGIGLAETLSIQGLTIAFALAGLGPYAFVLPMPLVAIFRTATAWYLTRPDLTGLFHRLGRIKYLMNNSLAVFATGAVQAAISQGDYVVLGVLGNDVAVGIYFFAFKMASQPLLLMASSLSSVLFPALSQLRSSPDAQAVAALRAAKMLGLLIMPIAFMQAGLIEPAIHLFFRSKWDASIPLMQILSIALGFDAISWVASTLLTAQRGFRQQLIYVASFAPPFFLLVIIGGWNGSPIGVALGVAAYYMLVTPFYSYIVFRRSGMGFRQLIWLYFMPALVASVGIGGAVWLVSLLHLDSYLLRIALTSVLGALLYAGVLRTFEPASFGEIVELLRHMTTRRSRPAPASFVSIEDAPKDAAGSPGKA